MACLRRFETYASHMTKLGSASRLKLPRLAWSSPICHTWSASRSLKPLIMPCLIFFFSHCRGRGDRGTTHLVEQQLSPITPSLRRLPSSLLLLVSHERDRVEQTRPCWRRFEHDSFNSQLPFVLVVSRIPDIDAMAPTVLRVR